MVELARARHPELEFVVDSGESFVRDEQFDYVLLSDFLPFVFDLQALLRNVRGMTHYESRIVIHSYSQLWRPAIRIAELARLKPEKPIRNWVTPEDVTNVLALADFEVVSDARRILIPKGRPFSFDVRQRVRRQRLAAVTPSAHLVDGCEAETCPCARSADRLDRRAVPE